MKRFVWFLVFLLIVLHQDVWNWDNDRLLWGFLPVTLAYHIGLSLAAAATWLLVVNFAWPKELEVADD